MKPSAAVVIGASLVLSLWACKGRGPTSPEQLRGRYAQALRDDDPDAAYDLMSPEVQASISREAFGRRWRQERDERKQAIGELEALDPDHSPAVHSGTTAHDDGVVLRWVRAGDRYLIVDGLPGLPDTTTPNQTIRAFIAAVRSADMASFGLVLATELTEAMREDWTARVDAIEKALARPGAVELSQDLQRAELRYGPQRALTLQQTARGWRITALE